MTMRPLKMMNLFKMRSRFMSKVVFSIKSEVKIAPVVYMEMISKRRNAGAYRSRKDYSRKEKHRGQMLKREMEA